MKTKIVNSEFQIVKLSEKNSFVIEKENGTLTLYDSKLIEDLISSNFNKKYRQFLYIINDIVNNGDDSGTDTDILVLEIEKLKNKLLNKYFKYLSHANLQKYLKMLVLLEEKLAITKRGKGR